MSAPAEEEPASYLSCKESSDFADCCGNQRLPRLGLGWNGRHRCGCFVLPLRLPLLLPLLLPLRLPLRLPLLLLLLPLRLLLLRAGARRWCRLTVRACRSPVASCRPQELARRDCQLSLRRAHRSHDPLLPLLHLA
jgi:hypothetical protein